MHDIVIRGGTILDGTGAPGFTGDVAIDGERGYRTALVAGTPSFENGGETGARPGRLVRAGQ